MSFSRFSGITVHPGEDASAKEEADWWRIFDGVITTANGVHYIAGAVPPRMAHLADADLTDFAEMTVPAKTAEPYLEMVDHNRKVRAAKAENTRRAAMRLDHEWQSANALAAALDTQMRPRAASLLFRLQAMHRDPTRSTRLATNQYNGHAFVKTMRAEIASGVEHPSKEDQAGGRDLVRDQPLVYASCAGGRCSPDR